MALEDFRAAAYVANVNAGHVGGYLDTAKNEQVWDGQPSTFWDALEAHPEALDVTRRRTKGFGIRNLEKSR
jgi:hypothetical protein